MGGHDEPWWFGPAIFLGTCTALFLVIMIFPPIFWVFDTYLVPFLEWWWEIWKF